MPAISIGMSTQNSSASGQSVATYSYPSQLPASNMKSSQSPSLSVSLSPSSIVHLPITISHPTTDSSLHAQTSTASPKLLRSSSNSDSRRKSSSPVESPHMSLLSSSGLVILPFEQKKQLLSQRNSSAPQLQYSNSADECHESEIEVVSPTSPIPSSISTASLASSATPSSTAGESSTKSTAASSPSMSRACSASFASLASASSSASCCSDFWFANEDSCQLRAIHGSYMNFFDLSTTRRQASRAPLAFISAIGRKRITSSEYRNIIQQENENKNNKRARRRQAANGATCCSECPAADLHDCSSTTISSSGKSPCRVYSVDEVHVHQRDCVPLGLTMKCLQKRFVLTVWENHDGLPIHHHLLRNKPKCLQMQTTATTLSSPITSAISPASPPSVDVDVSANAYIFDSWMKCSPVYSDDLTGVKSSDQSFTLHNLTAKEFADNAQTDSAESFGYASLEQISIFDALERLGRPTNAQQLMQLSQFDDGNKTESHALQQHKDEDENELKCDSDSDDDEQDDADKEDDDEAEDEHDEYTEPSEAEAAADEIEDCDKDTPLNSPCNADFMHVPQSSIRRHQSESAMSTRVAALNPSAYDEVAALAATLGFADVVSHMQREKDYAANKRNDEPAQADDEEAMEDSVDGDDNQKENCAEQPDDGAAAAHTFDGACGHGW